MAGQNTGPGAFEDLPPSTVSCILFFGSIIFTVVSMATKAFLSEDTRGMSGEIGEKVEESPKIVHPHHCLIKSFH